MGEYSVNSWSRWVVLFGVMLTYAATNGILIHSLPLLNPELMDHFGWTASEVTLPATVFLIVTAVTSPPIGYLLDRYSAKRIILFGLVGIIASLFAYARVAGLNDLVLVYAVLGLSLSFCGLVSNMLVVTRWFTELRGRATGLLIMSSSAGGVFFPWLVKSTVEDYGWQQAMNVLAVAIIILAVLPVLLLVRDRPDAASVSTAKVSAATPVGPGFVQALSEPRFYMLALATAATWFSMMAIIQHQTIYLTREVGFDRTALTAMLSVFFAASIAGKFLFGFMSDYVNRLNMLCMAIGSLAVGVFLLRSLNLDFMLLIYLYGVLAGAGFGGAFTTIQMVFAEFYAGHAYGRILAVLMFIDTVAGAIGVRVVAKLQEETGNYQRPLLMLSILLLVALVVLLLARRPGRTAKFERVSGSVS